MSGPDRVREWSRIRAPWIQIGDGYIRPKHIRAALRLGYVPVEISRTCIRFRSSGGFLRLWIHGARWDAEHRDLSNAMREKDLRETVRVSIDGGRTS